MRCAPGTGFVVMVRMHCLIPFCRCTRTRTARDAAGTEWICAKHWRLVPRTVKDARTLAACRYRRTRMRDRLYPHIESALQGAWRECKAAAIEAAGGIV